MPHPARRLERHAFDHALLPSGWARNVEIAVDAEGSIVDVRQVLRVDPRERRGAYAVPGMPNLHSHAFQRAMAGLAERRGGAGDDDFWSWREAMYRLAGAIDPDAQHAIAAQLQVEMLEAGYTAVCEFHYVHHGVDGSPLQPTTAMADAIVAAAADTGIGLTLLPVLYRWGGFGRVPLAPRQRRFGNTVDAYVALVEDLARHRGAQVELGIALHSLRAVAADEIAAVLAADPARGGPIHIHVAEQLREVDDCFAATGRRPVAWLLDHAGVDARWCLVHATHVDADEICRAAASGAVVGICPTTEANLGDGVFPFPAWRAAGGRWGVGSDSHVSVSPVEDLRWLEYAQRLVHRVRNVAADSDEPSVGHTLWRESLAGGAQASGRALGAIAVGRRADLVVLDDAAAQFAGVPLAQVLDAFVFAGNRNLVRDVMVGGRWQVRDGRHRDRDAIAARYRAAIARLST
jgi:formimidoylglutamate deiminase